MKRQKDFKIDFVIPWVDGSDKEWIKEKEKYFKDTLDIDAEAKRFRDWNILQYWFRGVEKYAPWVNKIYFITWGHIPSWLNTDNDKLVIVNHQDYIPAEYLPTFSSHTIELNMHRIKGLSEHFVYFNDDFFLTSEVNKEDFFINSLPCDLFVEDPITFRERDVVNSVVVNDMIAINNTFSRRAFLKKYQKKIYVCIDKTGLIKNLLMRGFKRDYFTGIEFNHLPQAYLKSSFIEAWKTNGDWLDETCKSRFRSVNDLNQWYIKFYQMLSGKFEPYNWRKTGCAFHLNDNKGDSNIKDACRAIANQRYKMICLNDAQIHDFDKSTKMIDKAFRSVLPEKCSFEK